MIPSRLKLYNSKITIRLQKSEKNKMKRNAFKNKMTMSNYIRYLITLDNRLNEVRKNDLKNEKYLDEINKISINIGRNV